MSTSSFRTTVVKTVSKSLISSNSYYFKLNEAVEPGKIGWSATGTSLYCVIKLFCADKGACSKEIVENILTDVLGLKSLLNIINYLRP